jgi:hypothetical protein
MKIATSELEHLREEVKNCHRIIKDLQKKREFVGLTDEDRDGFVQKYWNDELTTMRSMMKDVEAKLKEKNGL